MAQFEFGKIYPVYLWQGRKKKLCRIMPLFFISKDGDRTNQMRAVKLGGPYPMEPEIINMWKEKPDDYGWRYGYFKRWMFQYGVLRAAPQIVKFVVGAKPRDVGDDKHRISELVRYLIDHATTEQNLLTMMEIRKALINLVGEDQAQLLLDASL